jgi:hypothetical protein
VPSDDSAERFDDVKGPDAWVLEHRAGGVAESEAADDDVERRSGGFGEGESGELDLGFGEEARHEVLVAERDLVEVYEHGGVETGDGG